MVFFLQSSQEFYFKNPDSSVSNAEFVEWHIISLLMRL